MAAAIVAFGTGAADPWTPIGNGVAYEDTHAGDGVFIGYAGYAVSDDEARAWVDALDRGWLHDRGVGHLYAVRGPDEPLYRDREIANTALATHLLARVGPNTPFIAIASHSSGALVADELLGQLFEQRADAGACRGRIVYYDLDGSTAGLDDTILSSLRRAYLVTAHSETGGASLNEVWMKAGATDFPSTTLLFYDASASGCASALCVHVSLVNTRPHDPQSADPARDYVDFAGRPVNAWYLDATADALR